MSHGWKFKLYINNQTSRTLKVDSPELQWGFWYTNSEDNKKPVDVKPGQNIEALGIRAADGTATGYECNCVWIDPTSAEEEPNIGSIYLKVDVPYSANNDSELTTSGFLKEEGWHDLPKSGHDFSRQITVLEMGGKFVIEESLPEIVDMEYERFIANQVNDNKVIQNWPSLEKELKVINGFNPLNCIPKQYDSLAGQTFVGRSEQDCIDKNLWAGIYDPEFPTLYSKQAKVEEYFSVAVYSYNTNPRNVESVAAGVSTVHVSTVEVSTSIKTTLETNYSLRALLKTESSDPITGSTIAAELESTYSQTNVLEESTCTYHQESRTTKIDKADHTRLFVPWVFLQAIVVYRKTKNGEYGLVGISEWANEVINKVYDEQSVIHR
ncbi:hypothetical protein ACXHQ2_08405 [Vibrio chemaguriensis]